MNFLIKFTTLVILVELSYQIPNETTIPAPTPVPATNTVNEKFSEVNYCAYASNETNEYCAHGDNVLGCTPPAITYGCSAMVLLNITNDVTSILESHNELRANVAVGLYANFKKATKMKRVYWDDELQYLAELRLKHCSVSADRSLCYVTSLREKSFAITGFKAIDGNTPAYIYKDILKDWYKSLASINLESEKYIFWGQHQNLPYMIHDEVDKVGCAAGTFRLQLTNSVALICAYNKYLKLSESQIYTFGPKTCSACDVYGKAYKCLNDLCYTATGGSDFGQTALSFFGDNFGVLLIGGAIGIIVVTVAISYIRIRFCL